MSAHSEPLSQLLAAFSTNPEQGLSSRQAAHTLSQVGENRLKKAESKTLLQRFLDQFKDLMILILVAAALVSFIVACTEGTAHGFFEPVLILAIVLLNAILGVMQESRAERALDALKNLSAPHARVLRDGQSQVIEAWRLVPGDVIHLEAGDFVPADARLIRSSGLRVEESALTGESLPAEKDAAALLAGDAPLGDRVNMVYSGCAVTYGTATALVTATGMNTEMGKIAGLLEGTENDLTPLQKKLARLGKTLGFLALGICGVIFLLGAINQLPLLDLFMTAVSLAVSAIPEGLPAIVTIVLSIGVQRMVKKNAIIRRLPAVETLGSASVICSDKTGTLTQNRMTVVRAYAVGASDSESVEGPCSPAVRTLLRCGALCCDGEIRTLSDGQVQHIGDPTETAIVWAAQQQGMPREQLMRANPRVAELPFDSDRKLMTVVCQVQGQLLVIVKGALDMLLPRCVSGVSPEVLRQNEAMSGEALRVLAVAYKPLSELPAEISPETLEQGLHLAGLLGMIDPPRPEARDAVALCRQAGIRPVMITGDHVITASAIARDLGILPEGGQAMTGAELDALSDQELDQQVEKTYVYARVSPENKIRIVQSWQRRGQVVAMTGDGVNDAPALKAADIGCAMGITGTDVAKGAADMTLTDDNFSTIVDAVREGRGIYANIKKVVCFLLGTNIGEVLLVFLSMLFWHQSPLVSMQLLWINLVTDSLPAVALGMEPVEPDIMRRPPQKKNESLFAGGMGVRIGLQGLLFAVLSLIAFRLGWNQTGQLEGGRTMAFLVLSLSQIIHAFNMRSDHSLLRIGPFGNRKLNGACLLSLVLVLAIVFTPAAVIFGLTALPFWLYAVGFGLALLPLPVMELCKAAGWVRRNHA